MVVLIVESAPVGLRGELSKWMLEPKAGVFVGTVSGAVRELLWEKACEEVQSGGVTLIYRMNNEQGFAIRSHGETSRQVEEWEGLFLVRRPNAPPPEVEPAEAVAPEPDWQALLHPSIWAKTDRGVTLGTGEPPWHPLIAHMIDVAWVARRMWQYLIPSAVKERVRLALGLSSTDEAGEWIAFFAGLHDLGKASPKFALREAPTLTRLKAEGFRKAERDDDVPSHGFVTTHLLEQLLPDLGISKESARAVGFAVGGHHGTFPHRRVFRDIRRQVGSGRWAEASRNLMRTLAHALGVDRLAPPQGDLAQASDFMVILAGLTSVADWIGSDHRYFKFVGDEIHLPRYPRRARWLALKALIDLGWFHRPSRVEPVAFEELFDMVPNHLQSAIIDLGERLTESSLILVEYPMGGGKTEGALYLANLLHARAGQQGFYLALPTMATSNQMFQRASEYLRNRFPGETISVQLRHGHADLHEEFAAMQAKDAALPEPPVIEGEESNPRRADARLLAAEWFTHRKRGLLAPYGIGTIDQVLVGALQTRHYFVRLFGLAGKVVIVDEVHAYDTYMQKLLSTLLTWLGALGSSVILLSATLPAATRERLLRAYSLGRGMAHPVISAEVPYPRITWANGQEIGAAPLPAPAERSLSLRFVEPGMAWMEELVERLTPGGCVAVLCNTVGRAQEVYQALRDLNTDCEILLFHARFPFDDRQRIEREVLGRFGKGSVDRPHRAICVATQVIEQSLDLDFDLMVTELAPIDLLLQRSGRIWRHRREERPTHFMGPEMWVISPSFDADGLPDFPPKKRSIYDPHLLLRTWLAVHGLEDITVPGMVEPLLESVYSKSDPAEEISPSLATYWLKTAHALEHGEGEEMQEAERRVIPQVSDAFQDQAADTLDEEDEGIHAAMRAMTRLGGLAVEVICLVEQNHHFWTLPTGGERVDLDRKPGRDQVRSLLGRSLRFSFNPKLVKQILDLQVPDTWEATTHLRRHRLLAFAPDGACLTEGFPLRLDPELGLVYVPGEKEAST